MLLAAVFAISCDQCAVTQTPVFTWSQPSNDAPIDGSRLWWRYTGETNWTLGWDMPFSCQTGPHGNERCFWWGVCTPYGGRIVQYPQPLQRMLTTCDVGGNPPGCLVPGQLVDIAVTAYNSAGETPVLDVACSSPQCDQEPGCVGYATLCWPCEMSDFADPSALPDCACPT